MNRKAFFDAVRKSLFVGRVAASQVSGMSAILDEWERRGLTDLRWIAYMLATTFHETAKTMQPIEEYGRGKGRRYGQPVNGKVYYGRGYVQLTWADNYERMGKLLGVDLLNHPARALDPDVAAAIMFEGMTRGMFTGRKLSDHFNDRRTDWRGARKIVNGLDRADLIAGHATAFHAALLIASDDLPAPSPDIEPHPPETSKPFPEKSDSPLKQPVTWLGGLGVGGLGIGGLFAGLDGFTDWRVALAVVVPIAALAAFALTWLYRRGRSCPG